MRALSPASAQVRRVLFDVLRQHHKPLARINLAIVAVTSDRPIPPVQVKVMGPNARSAGAADAVVMVDALAWSDATEAEQLATVDHALCQIEPVMKGDAYALDIANRPRVRRRPPTLVVNGYPEALERHGVSSIERGQTDALKAILDRQGTAAMRDRIKRRHSRTNPDSARPYP